MLPYVISSKLRRKLLTHYFTHPDEKYYVREIAALLSLDPGNLSKELRRLTEEGLFQEEPKGRIRFYRLNPRYPLYLELKQIIFKTEGIEGSLRQCVEKFPAIRLAFIYGSYAKGEERASSDIDLVVVGELDRRRFTSQIRALEERLGREINFTLYPDREFRTKLRAKGSFLADVTRGKKIILKGKLDEGID
ncbi:MAG: nucleotidyltransferase domain-containing protein [Candidatus Omnitrophica bacterium]|nr:nucleotidyltransferase domain-containing protein [Candidatus Omnitrophota bacterium]